MGHGGRSRHDAVVRMGQVGRGMGREETSTVEGRFGKGAGGRRQLSFLCLLLLSDLSQ